MPGWGSDDDDEPDEPALVAAENGRAQARLVSSLILRSLRRPEQVFLVTSAHALMLNSVAAARILGITWDEAHGIMARAVARGLLRREHTVAEYVGLDEKFNVKRDRGSAHGTRTCRTPCSSQRMRGTLACR